jgi:hypothetical protein
VNTSGDEAEQEKAHRANRAEVVPRHGNV